MIGNLILKGLISIEILKIDGPYTKTTYGSIKGKLGASSWDDKTISIFMIREMKKKSDITKENQVLWVKPFIGLIIKYFNKPANLIKFLNLDEAVSAEKQFKEDFGVSFKNAKEIYSMGFLGFYL